MILVIWGGLGYVGGKFGFSGGLFWVGWWLLVFLVSCEVGIIQHTLCGVGFWVVIWVRWFWAFVD